MLYFLCPGQSWSPRDEGPRTRRHWGHGGTWAAGGTGSSCSDRTFQSTDVSVRAPPARRDTTRPPSLPQQSHPDPLSSYRGSPVPRLRPSDSRSPLPCPLRLKLRDRGEVLLPNLSPGVLVLVLSLGSPMSPRAGRSTYTCGPKIRETKPRTRGSDERLYGGRARPGRVPSIGTCRGTLA